MIAILGAGGHTRSLLNILELNDCKIFGIYDETFDPRKEEWISGHKVLGDLEHVPADCQVVVSKGNNYERNKLLSRFQAQLFKGSLTHPVSRIEKNVMIEGANQIFANVFINSGVRIGRNNIFNTGSIIEHEVVVGSHNHISVSAIVCGRARIGNFCFIGAGAVIIDQVSIADNVVIGAGAVVSEDIAEAGTYVGVPGRRIK